MIHLKRMERLYDALQHYTEKYLTYRKRKKAERVCPAFFLVVMLYQRLYCLSRFSACWGAMTLLTFSVYSVSLAVAVTLMSRLEEPMRKVY